MAHGNVHSFMFTFGWARFSGSGYLGMEKNAARGR